MDRNLTEPSISQILDQYFLSLLNVMPSSRPVNMIKLGYLNFPQIVFKFDNKSGLKKRQAAEHTLINMNIKIKYVLQSHKKQCL